MKAGAAPLALLLLLLCSLLAPAAWSADRARFVVAGAERGMSAQIVRDIAKYIAQPADIELDIRYSIGSPDTLLRLREGNGAQFALLQADVAEAFLGAATRGSAEADQLFAPIRALMPLYDEEICFLVRSDSPLNFVHEIAGSRINLGPSLGGSALSVSTLYRLMFGTTLPEKQASFHAHQDALVKLTEQTVDVVAFVSPRPAQLLADMKPEARRFVKLLKFATKHPSAAAVGKVYTVTQIPATSYPNLLTDDLPALAVKIYLVSHGKSDALQTRFGSAWCLYLPSLSEAGHVALRDLKLELPRLAPGWQYASPFATELRACIDAKRGPVPADSCTKEDQVLGLCR